MMIMGNTISCTRERSLLSTGNWTSSSSQWENSTDLEPNKTQRITLIVIAVYAVFIGVAWNVWGLRCERSWLALLSVAEPGFQTLNLPIQTSQSVIFFSLI